MSRAKPKYASVTWEDLLIFVGQLRTEHDLAVEFSLENDAGKPQSFRATVRLREGARLNADGQTIKTVCGPVSLRPDAQAGELLFMLNSAYVSYQDDPWNWTLRSRRREVSAVD